MMTAKVMAGILAMAVLSGVPAEAQTAQPSFALSPSSGPLRAAAGQQRFPGSNAKRERTTDSLGNGIAMGVGIALGAYVGTALLVNPRMLGCGADEPGASIAVCLGAVGALGGLAGAAIDSRHSRQLYSRQIGRAAVGVTPAVTPKRAGMRLALSF